jgi:hypothetical protein
MADADLRRWPVKGAERRLAGQESRAKKIFTMVPELHGHGLGFDVATSHRASAVLGLPTRRRRRKDVSCCAARLSASE